MSTYLGTSIESAAIRTYSTLSSTNTNWWTMTPTWKSSKKIAITMIDSLRNRPEHVRRLIESKYNIAPYSRMIMGYWRRTMTYLPIRTISRIRTSTKSHNSFPRSKWRHHPSCCNLNPINLSHLRMIIRVHHSWTWRIVSRPNSYAIGNVRVTHANARRSTSSCLKIESNHSMRN